ncbi:deoxyribodipyrimidine photo-lyase [Ciceribacter sp. L1K22]|uniref:cryptochrome/photolyase family protein n=1 Tax=Ciceribacter sp. L1K22 TaxID=2820275 RepID=UPI001ABE1099|nr:deoxyribodipyrimidine photo-lyase [Ciceribacter sp. L1K22]MBO3760016.1 deoxyribodipyrimidine photo-lyase [Ciceribacter sp. L1K22]
MVKPVILLFRKDLRLDDNLALASAVESGRPVVPVYIREPESGAGPLGAAQAWWLHHSLTALSKALDKAGSRLVLRSGHSLDVIKTLLTETDADGVYWNRRYDPVGSGIDKALKAWLRENGFEAESFSGQLMHEPSKLKTGAGGPYRVYSPFWRALEQQGEPAEPVAAPGRIAAPTSWPDGETLDDWRLLPTKPDWASTFTEVWEPGEAAAQRRLADFIDEKLAAYKDGRDFPGRDVTSMLSPHLAMGEISPARIWHATRGLKSGITDSVVKFRKELAWRDFSYHLLFHFPELATKNWNERFDQFGWTDDETAFEAWTKGLTGYPIVDAGMRELWRHGTMHNRVRMIVASFLIKDLRIDWRRGEAWFRDTLADADPASNAASWQWVAGSGADAAPFFRIFNPILQGEKFDPDGTYVRRFVPELKAMPDKFIHKPFEAPLLVLKEAGVTLGKTYPKPIVDHGKARDAAMAAYNALPKAG